jgi:uncharacterized protein HemX
MSDISTMQDPSSSPESPESLEIKAAKTSNALQNTAVSSNHVGNTGFPKLFTIVMIAALAISMLASFYLWRKLTNMQEHLARQSADATNLSVEARSLAKNAQDVAREASARSSLNETRLSEVALQRSQLDELMQSLSRSRDENLVVDVESALRLAQQQAQLTGSVEPLLAALKTADQRLTRAAQPRLNAVRRALASDADKIKAAAVTDIPSLLVKLDEISRLVEDLPVLNTVTAVARVDKQNAPNNASSKASGAKSAAVCKTSCKAIGKSCVLSSRNWCVSAALKTRTPYCSHPNKPTFCVKTSNSKSSMQGLACWVGKFSLLNLT